MIQVTFADRAKEPHPLVGIETGDVPGFAQLVQAIQEETDRADVGMLFDIQRIYRNTSTSLTDALLQVPPFYTRGARQKFN